MPLTMDYPSSNAEGDFSGSPQRDRKTMIEYLRSQGIRDELVLQAMGNVPRHQFIQESLWDDAYANLPLPIDEEQTISQPYMVALMTESLTLTRSDRVLEIGTGSGYQTAILAELVAEVYTIERFPTLSEAAQERLISAGYKNIHFKIGDGTSGWSENQPYDAIIATGAAPDIPTSFIKQLTDGGRIVIPVGNRQVQKLLLVRKRNNSIKKSELCYCRFLPLIGEEGWPVEQSTPLGNE